MVKSVQNKLMIFSMVIGTFIIGLIGYLYIQNISKLGSTNEIIDITKKYIIISIFLFITTSIIISTIAKKLRENQ